MLCQEFLGIVTRRDCHNSVNQLINRKREIEPPAKTFCLALVVRQVYFINIVKLNQNRTLYFIVGCESYKQVITQKSGCAY